MILYFPALCIGDNWQEKYNSLDEVEDTIVFWGMTLGKSFVESIWDFNVYDVIGGYTGDVLIMHGTDDEIVTLSYSEKATEFYSNCQLVVMDKEGHGFGAEGGKTARENVLNFMNEHIE